MRSTSSTLAAAFTGLATLLSTSVSAQQGSAPAAVSSGTGVSSPDCLCGYLDNTNQAIWTDRTITYFNESGAASDVVFQPEKAPSFQGILTAGDTGDGPQAWAAGQQTDPWEDAFGATWLAGTKYNNTFLPTNSTDGLALAVPPGDRQNRISYGAVLISRRRDIRYGSFRASIEPPTPGQGGTLIQMAVWYNQSQDVLTNIVTTDAANTAILQWDYSATGRDSNALNMNLTSGGGIGFQTREHRIDWLPESITWTNNAPNTIPYQQVFNDRNIFIPSVGMPFSLKHYSNGDSRLMEGPPLYHTPTAYIKYVRLFYNSSRPERVQEFEMQCANAGGVEVVGRCDVDNFQVRGSTEFDFEATQKQIPPSPHYHAPMYSKIATAVSAGLFGIIFLHAMARRYINKRKKQAEYMTQLREGEKRYSLNVIQQPSGFNTPSGRGTSSPNSGYQQRSIRGHSSPDGSEPAQVNVGGSLSLMQSGAQTPYLPYGSEFAGSVTSFDSKYEEADALAKWDDPRFMRDSDSEASSDDDDDFKDDPLETRSVRTTLHSFGHGAFNSVSGIATPGAASVAHGSTYVAPEYRINNGRSTYGGSQSHGYLSAANSVRQMPMNNEESSEEGNSRPGSIAQTPSMRHFSRSSRPGRSDWDLHSTDGQISINGIALSHDHRRPSHTDSFMTQDMPGISSADRMRWAGGLTGIGAPESEAGHTSVGNFGDYSAKRPSMRTDAQSFVNVEGREHPVKWETKIMEWQPLDPNKDMQEGGQLAAPTSGKNMLPERTKSPATKKIGRLARFWKNMLVGEGEGKATASGAARVEYLDGLRGFACFLVSFHHFMLIFYYHATTPAGQAHYPDFENYFHFILGPILVNGGLNVGIFFVLSARVIANRYLVRGRLQDLAEATYRRVPRLAVPISAAIIINYFLIQAQAFAWVRKLASRTWSTWSYYHDYNNVGYFFNSWLSLWFVIPPDVPLLISTYATGILWTVPIIVQTSWTVFTCALIAREFTNHYKRYAFYSACFMLSWWNNRFDYFFIAGLMIADADNKLKYREVAAKGIPIIPGFMRSCLPKRVANVRVHGQVFAWVIFLAGAVTSWLYFVGEEFRNPDGTTKYGSEFNQQEWGIHPNYATGQPWAWTGGKPDYTDPRLHDFFFVIGYFLLCDLCPSFRMFFQLRAWNFLGRNAFSLYLCHGVAFWSWGAWLCLQLLNVGVPYWATILVVFITSYIILFIMCECFTRTFDVWGIGVSKSIWRAQSGGLGRRV
ncbi:hypothetical protein OC846_002961 [Tilletia horrida]|uniref:Acyltransferase 3 domain-containing protein n=1 Tax=Tilletia horrida TaxID=155126 RepID=A0AAN6GPW4_9BASI|nr:hypothetical protein OC846_002961 [Tilletia horrida]KAK0566831.1 hypothetical protein OC861_003027 [Tilletia horrida]